MPKRKGTSKPPLALPPSVTNDAKSIGWDLVQFGSLPAGRRLDYHQSPLLIPRTVGSVITKRVQYKLTVENFGHDTKPPHITEEDWRDICLNAWEAITPEQTTYNNIETLTKQILETANLPTEDTLYTIPDGTTLDPEAQKSYSGRKGNLISLVEARGYKERINIEWYAAKMLLSWLAVRGCAEKGKPNAAILNAFVLGMLTQEMQTRFEVFAGFVRKGGSREKHIPAVFSFVLRSLRVTRSLKEPKIWSKLPHDQFEAVKVGKNKLFTERNRLYVLEKKDGKNWTLSDRSLSRAAFKKYVTKARKFLDR